MRRQNPWYPLVVFGLMAVSFFFKDAPRTRGPEDPSAFSSPSVSGVASVSGKHESNKLREPASTQEKPASEGSLPPPPFPVADQFAGAEALDIVETPVDSEGRFQVVKVLKTASRFGIVRIKEKWILNTQGKREHVATRAMIGTQVLVQLAPGADSQQLRSLVRSLGGTLEDKAAFSPLYTVSFEGARAESMDVLLRGLRDRSDLVELGVPNFIHTLSRDPGRR